MAEVGGGTLGQTKGWTRRYGHMICGRMQYVDFALQYVLLTSSTVSSLRTSLLWFNTLTIKHLIQHHEKLKVNCLQLEAGFQASR